MNKGISNIEVRVINRKNILNVLYRYGAMTKQDIASILDISVSTVSILIKDLSLKGLVETQGALESSGGRRPALISFVSDARFAIGITLLANSVQFVLITLSGEQVCAHKFSMRFSNTDEYWMELSERIRECIGKSDIEESRILGVGVSVSDEIDAIGSINKSKLSSQLGFAVEVGNDVRMAAMAQIWNKVEPGPALYVSLHNTVSGAIIAGYPEIFYGSESAGQFGHMTIIDGGKDCPCKKKGCFDTYCSSRALQADAGQPLESFFLAVEAGEKAAKDIWDQYLDHLAIALNNLYVIFRTVIIIGGEMCTYIKKYKEDLKAKLEARNPFDDEANYIRVSDLGDNDAAFGAAVMQVSHFLQ